LGSAKEAARCFLEIWIMEQTPAIESSEDPREVAAQEETKEDQLKSQSCICTYIAAMGRIVPFFFFAGR
jgi:hypothetical protein